LGQLQCSSSVAPTGDIERSAFSATDDPLDGGAQIWRVEVGEFLTVPARLIITARPVKLN